jgi:putative transposase
LVRRNGKPGLINIDKSRANKAAILEFNKENNTRIKVRKCKYLNNIVEADHRFVKRKMWQAMGFGSFDTATKTIAGIELWRMLKKGQKK